MAGPPEASGENNTPQLLGWGPTMYSSPQLLGHSFQKARNFTASIVS